MADTAARRHYAGDRRLVECKQKTREGSVAHHEHVGAKSRAGGSTDTMVGVHSTHGGASDGDGNFPVTVMSKRTNQPVTKQYGIKAKLKQGFARAAANRRAKAMVKRTRR